MLAVLGAADGLQLHHDGAFVKALQCGVDLHVVLADQTPRLPVSDDCRHCSKYLDPKLIELLSQG